MDPRSSIPAAAAPGLQAPTRTACPATRTAARTQSPCTPRSSRYTSRIPGTADPWHPGLPRISDNPYTSPTARTTPAPRIPCTPHPQHSGLPRIRDSPKLTLSCTADPLHTRQPRAPDSALRLPRASDCAAPRNPCAPDTPNPYRSDPQHSSLHPGFPAPRIP